MKTSIFDAVIDFALPEKGQPLQALLLFLEAEIQGLISAYGPKQKNGTPPLFASVQLSRPLNLRWKDGFQVQARRGEEILGQGQVLSPVTEKKSPRKDKKRLAFLGNLLGDEKALIFALAQEKGVDGLAEKEVQDFASISSRALHASCQKLEEEGKVRIVSFAPLFLLTQSSLEFICQRILTYLTQFHLKHPEELGVPVEKVRKKFGLHPRILALTLGYLSRRKKISQTQDRVALAGFQVSLSPEEEKLLAEMERMAFDGQLRSVSWEDLQKRFRLSSQKLNRMLFLLIERKKIIQGKDGFFLHSRWLDEIIHKIRQSGGKELSVSEFKALTGLTRKYAIPLLELLDQMGVTRRKGKTREILD